MCSLCVRIFIFFALLYKHTSYIAWLYIIGQIQQESDLKKSMFLKRKHIEKIIYFYWLTKV